MSESRTTYKVGYFVGSLSSTSINRTLSRSLIRLAPPELEFTEIPIGNLPLYSPDHDADYPPGGQGAEGGHRAVGRRALRDPRVQPVHSRRAQERDRLGVAPM